MNFSRSYIYILLSFVCLSSCKILLKQKETLPPPLETKSTAKVEMPDAIIKVGNQEIIEPQLAYEISSYPSIDSMNSDEILSDIIKKRLFVEDAKNLKYESKDEFEEEINTYKSIILKDYLIDKEVIKYIQEQSYKNYLSEVNASHLFIPISYYASPEDTLKLYNELLNLRTYALKNDNFSLLAKEWSKDLKTNEKGGSLGWNTALSLIFPLELITFNTPVDSISLPVRTNAGYHLIKVNAKRQNSGKVKVQHIFKYLKPNFDANEFEINMRILDSLKVELDKGASFNELVVKYSDDVNSKEKFGELPIFGIGTREESNFEEAAFSLKVGEISTPVRSTSGLHLIKLSQKYPLDTKEVFLNKINEKIKTDSRGAFIEEQNIKLLKKKLNLIEYESIFRQSLSFADDRLVSRTWTKIDSDIAKFTLFEIANNKYFVNDFFDFIVDRQKYERWRSSENYEQIFRFLYTQFLNKKLQEISESTISADNPEIRQILDSQRNDLLYSRYYEDKIIQKSLSDSVGLNLFFNDNKDLFKSIETAKIRIYEFKNTDIRDKFEDQRNKEKPYQLFRGIKPMYFTKNDYTFKAEDKRKLVGLLNILQKNPGYRVEVGGHEDITELEKTSSNRIASVISFLTANGLPITRVLEVDYRNSKPIDRFDWSKNQRVSFQFYSDEEKDLVKLFTDTNPNDIVLTEKIIDLNTYKELYNLPWESGIYKITKNGHPIEIKLNRIVRASGIYAPKAVILAAYQKYLTTNLTTDLTKKYKVEIDNKKFEEILKNVKK